MSLGHCLKEGRRDGIRERKGVKPGSQYDASSCISLRSFVFLRGNVGPSEGSLKWCSPTARIFRGCGKWVESICDVALYELCNRPKFFCYNIIIILIMWNVCSIAC